MLMRRESLNLVKSFNGQELVREINLTLHIKIT